MSALLKALIILIILVVIGYAGIQYVFRRGIQNRSIEMTTSPILGICPRFPNKWEKIRFANKTVCQEPGTVSLVDRCLNPTSFMRGACPDANKRTVDGKNYCLTEDITRGLNQSFYTGWGCSKNYKSSQDDVKIPK